MTSFFSSSASQKTPQVQISPPRSENPKSTHRRPNKTADKSRVSTPVTLPWTNKSNKTGSKSKVTTPVTTNKYRPSSNKNTDKSRVTTPVTLPQTRPISTSLFHKPLHGQSKGVPKGVDRSHAVYDGDDDTSGSEGDDDHGDGGEGCSGGVISDGSIGEGYSGEGVVSDEGITAEGGVMESGNRDSGNRDSGNRDSGKWFSSMFIFCHF